MEENGHWVIELLMKKSWRKVEIASSGRKLSKVQSSLCCSTIHCHFESIQGLDSPMDDRASYRLSALARHLSADQPQGIETQQTKVRFPLPWLSTLVELLLSSLSLCSNALSISICVFCDQYVHLKPIKRATRATPLSSGFSAYPSMEISHLLNPSPPPRLGTGY